MLMELLRNSIKALHLNLYYQALLHLYLMEVLVVVVLLVFVNHLGLILNGGITLLVFFK